MCVVVACKLRARVRMAFVVEGVRFVFAYFNEWNVDAFVEELRVARQREDAYFALRNIDANKRELLKCRIIAGAVRGGAGGGGGDHRRKAALCDGAICEQLLLIGGCVRRRKRLFCRVSVGVGWRAYCAERLVHKRDKQNAVL